MVTGVLRQSLTVAAHIPTARRARRRGGVALVSRPDGSRALLSERKSGVYPMDFIRIGEKLVSRERIIHMIDRILEKRTAGASQQEAANDLGVDRSFVSRLETLGEIRKGGRIALIGFPVANKAELDALCLEYGVDYTLLLTDQERWQLANGSTGTDLINQLMQLMATIRSYDTVIFIGSNMRINLAEALTDKQLISISIGESPIQGDRYVDPQSVRQILEGLRGAIVS